ncbi:uncharacterized protein TNCT_134081 [Trichonephila clavata]|uniref:Vitellogenin n=1 Tax=Trichonephila clavata TaxID=2740835 RepID=A0A8X6FY05_TRICU|nr:uncharacterized protein TNCT_134081 [Trichonephila clavata]
MRLFSAALVLLFLGVANAIPENKLSYPRFETHKTHFYDVWINTTAGIPGMSPQVSKSVIKAELQVYAHSQTVLIIRIQNVRASGSIHRVDSTDDPVSIADLHKTLGEPIKVTWENGMVKKYTLAKNETLESKTIKKAILRNMQIYINDTVIQSLPELKLPQHFNLSRSSPYGNYSSYYIIMTSPYPNFPFAKNVYNISRTDNFEVSYPAYHTHNNFEEQGCPGVCRKNHVEDDCHSGCPSGWEPYQTIMKKGFVKRYSLRVLKSGINLIDIISTKETHVADLYDQNMEVTIKSWIRFKRSTNETIKEVPGQKVYENLDKDEIDEEEIKKVCKYPEPKEAVATAQSLLTKITRIVHEQTIQTEKTKSIGEHLVLLQKALALLRKEDLKTIQNTIPDWTAVKQATDEEKIKRQIWLDTLPLIGTEAAVHFITELIKENINKPEKTISLWESKNLLEALPKNILNPNRHILQSLMNILDILHSRETKGYGMYFSTSHIAVARVIRMLCANDDRHPEEDTRGQNLHTMLQRRERCPKQVVKKFITDIAAKLKVTTDKMKRVIYIETLCNTGLRSVIPIVKPYVNRRIPGLTPSSNDFVRSVTIFALHNIVAKHPQEVRQIVLPVYVNKTEPPKIRTAAFGVFIRSYPSLGELQLVATETWTEPSLEVGSHVTHTLDTLGNSSDPCYQQTVQHIKKVLPQVRRFYIGKQHAVNMYDSWFDTIRNFGLEHRFEMTPSNESFFPAAMYSAFSYNTGTWRDYLYKFALNAQGFTSQNFHDSFLQFLNLKPSEDIPKVKIPEIFPEAHVVPRDPEFWRFTVFQKLFYINSYYYYDSEEHQTDDIFHMLKEHFLQYFTDENGRISGHIVQVYLPSTYQTKAVGYALPSPVQFEMKNPLILSLKFDMKPTFIENTITYSMDISPSVYYSTLYSNQILNLRDCKHIGVYHEKKIAAIYPFKVIMNVESIDKMRMAYEFPELNKNVFTYTSEAGTYAGKMTLEELPYMKERSTIKTIPSQFVKEYRFGAPGFPAFQSRILTEDISFGKERIPETTPRIVSKLVQDWMNAGWRRKSVEIKRIPDERFWTKESKVEFVVNHTREFKAREKDPVPEDQWVKQLNFFADESNYKTYGKAIQERIETISHIEDLLDFTVVYKLSETESHRTKFHWIHRHTLGGALHTLHICATAMIPKLHTSLELHSTFAAAFLERPNEFKYGDGSYEKQLAILLGFVAPKHETFEDALVVIGAIGRYKSLESKLNKELHKPAPKRSFLPEAHEECVKDVKAGKPQSVHCLRAIYERSIYNHWDIHCRWNKEFPLLVQNIAYQTELLLKTAFASHLTTYKKPPTQGLHIDFTYINKLTDEPVIDVSIVMPNEVMKFERVKAGWMQPVSSIYSIRDSYIKHWTNITYPPSCTLMDNYVRTYDMKTIRTPIEKGCSYILTTHCLEDKKFAIISTTDHLKPGTKKIIIYVGKHTIVLTPPQKEKYVIKFDERDHEVHILQPILFEEQELIYAVSNVAADESYFVEIHAEKVGIIVTYDGRNVKTQVDTRYKGELCGLCSEFNGEIYREMRGPNRCMYTNSVDFTRSNIVGKCANKKIEHPYICANKENYEWNPEYTEEEYRPTLKKNIVLYEENRVCISKRAFPVCNREDSEVRTESKSVEFHCLNKSEMTKKLVIESKRRILAELETKPTDMTKEMDIAEMCSV